MHEEKLDRILAMVERIDACLLADPGNAKPTADVSAPRQTGPPPGQAIAVASCPGCGARPRRKAGIPWCPHCKTAC
jgi:hypothetical protein